MRCGEWGCRCPAALWRGGGGPLHDDNKGGPLSGRFDVFLSLSLFLMVMLFQTLLATVIQSRFSASLCGWSTATGLPFFFPFFERFT